MPDGRLQLVAWDLDRDATRRFDLDRMNDVNEGESFNPRFKITVPM